VIRVPSAKLPVIEANGRSEPRNPVLHIDCPVTPVDQVVMVGAEQAAIVHGRATAIGPVPDMVCFRPWSRPCASRKDTALVSGVKCEAEAPRDGSLSASDIENLTLATQQDRDDSGVASSTTNGAYGHRSRHRH
jgi:hypothetical protein